MRNGFDESDNIIDVRDIIARIEELESDIEDADTDSDMTDEKDELDELTALMDEMKGYGGDEQWRGDWYPITLIRDDYMESYAQELAEECGLIPKDAKWPMTCIDWDQATEEFKEDYSEVDFRGVIYWYR